jgi:carbonic anhydrase
LFIFGVHVRKSLNISKRKLVQFLALAAGYALFATLVIEIQDAVGSDPTKMPSAAHQESMGADTAGWAFDDPAHAELTNDADRSPAAASKKDTAAHEETFGVAPSEALRMLKEGNLRFVRGKVRKAQDGAAAPDRRRLAKGQSPKAIVVSCSDSRVPPEFVFDQRLGEIFVVRSAGESLDSSVLASIEYAASHLGTRLILVMGHDRCGAVQAALDTKPGVSTGSPHIDALVADIQPRIADRMRSPASTAIALESQANARGVARDLMQRSQILKKRVEEGKLEIRSALYHLETGTVDFD